MLKNIQIGWVWLERTLNGIIDQVNAQHIIPSATVAVQEAPNGTMLTAQGGMGDSTAQGAGDSAGGSWVTVTVVNPNTCAQSQIQVWSKPVSS